MKPLACDHPKTKRLARALGCCLPQAIGHLELLFRFCNRFALRGDVGRFSDEEIAEAALWEGDPSAFVGALMVAGWIDDHAAHRFVVHDWPDHASDYTKRKMKSGTLGCWAQEDPAPGPEDSGFISPMLFHAMQSNAMEDRPSDRGNTPTPTPKPKPKASTRVVEWARPAFATVNEALECYEKPRIDACRSGSTREGRWRLIRDKYAQGSAAGLGALLARAVHGYVCRNGLEDTDDFAAARHMQIDSIVRPSHLDENLTACAQAIELGWSAPFAKGAHTKKPPRKRQGGPRSRDFRPDEPPPPPLTDAQRAEARKATDELRKKLTAGE